MRVSARTLRLCAKALPLLAAVTVAAAQVPPRSTPTPATGTARLQGRIFDATTGAPIAGALVSLTRTPYVALNPRGHSTDDQGRFDFTELPAGRYELRADAYGYSGVSFGQHHPRELPRSFDLADKQTADIAIGLLRAGVIIVRLTNDFGEPLVKVPVGVHQARWVNGERQLRPAMHGRLIRTDSTDYGFTDDRGEVRVYGLAQGDYFVSATMNASVGVSSTGAPLNGAPITDASGRVYTPTYYPGTPVVTDAQPVTVGVGQEVEAAFMMAITRPVRISGRVVGSDGQPLAGTKLTMTGPVALKADGTFESPAVSPGDYTMTATGGYSGLVPLEWGQAQVKATFEDVRGVTINMVKPGALRGRFVADDGVALRDLRPGTLQLQPTPLPGSFVPAVVTPKWNADWTFEIGPLAGPYMLNLKQTPPGFYLKSILLAGADISREPFEVRGDPNTANLQVVVSRGAAEFSGTALNRDDSPAQDYFVVLFPEGQGEWKPYSRFIASGRADAQGKFAFTGLAPGRYLAAAVGYLDPGEERDLSVLQRLTKNATAVDLAPNDRKTTTLKIVAF